MGKKCRKTSDTISHENVTVDECICRLSENEVMRSSSTLMGLETDSVTFLIQKTLKPTTPFPLRQFPYIVDSLISMAPREAQLGRRARLAACKDAARR